VSKPLINPLAVIGGPTTDLSLALKSATRKLWQKSRWVLVNAVTGKVKY